MLLNLEVVPGSHRVLKGFEFGGVEFDNLATLNADHVVVMLMLVVVLVVRAPVAEAHFACESRFG